MPDSHAPISCHCTRQVSDFSSIAALLSKARSLIGDTLSAFEFIDRTSFEILQVNAPQLVGNLPQSMFPRDADM